MLTLKRLKQNPNLTLHSEITYKGYPLIGKYKPYLREYLESIRLVLEKSLVDHPRTFAVRIELRFPQDMRAPEGNAVISRFFASLKAQIKANVAKRNRGRVRNLVPETELGYVWVRECSQACNHHYHVAIFVNHETYNSLGDFNAVEDDLAAMVKKAWASALARPLFSTVGAAFFPRNSTYWLNAGDEWRYKRIRHHMFRRLSYLAKRRTKQYGDGVNSFGSSRVK